MGEIDRNDIILEGNTGLFKRFQHWCARNESDKLWPQWYVKFFLIDEGCTEAAELRGFDVGHDVLQVFAKTVEYKRSESGEDRVC
jgi:hypothetical protein